MVYRKLICFALALSSLKSTHAQPDTLAKLFANPPLAAKPRVWWHWMNGNVTKEGITADLEWMKRVGIGGMQVFDVDLGTPQVIQPSVQFMSDPWKDAFRHAGKEAARLGLEMGMATSGGWAESGSPWVQPEDGMKRLVWSELRIAGGKPVKVMLRLPDDLFKSGDTVVYHDIRIIAIPLPPGDSIGRISGLTSKAQYRVSAPDAQRLLTPEPGVSRAIDPAALLDLSDRLRPDGSLDWNVPAGNWEVVRLGYTLTGAMERLGTAASHGFEVDKLSRNATGRYLENYVGRLQQALGPYFGQSFQYLLMDSWEVGAENWTEDMILQFQQRRGYDPSPYLPVLAGYVVRSADISDRFLWDYRRTIADLVADVHYNEITKYAVVHGLKGIYAEAIGVEQPTTGDGLQAKGRVAVPMGEFVLEPWRLPGGRETNRADLKEAASAAHIYGKPLAGAEAFTTTECDPWAQAPYDLKPYADWAFSLGINQMVIHTSAHQPFIDEAHKPGITLGGAGQNYTRNNTWGEQSLAFNQYLARCSYLLQQGAFVADVLYYYGEDAPVVVPYWKSIEPHLPPGYDCDWINTEMLLKAVVKDGKIVLPVSNPVGYRVLVIPNDVTRLTLPVVRKLRDLVQGGAILLAPHPELAPGLTGYPDADDSIRAIGEEVWGPYGGIRRYHQQIFHPYGQGAVYSGLSVNDVLVDRNLLPDCRFTHPNLDDTIVWIHRQIENADIFFVANQQPYPMDFTGKFRVAGKEAELWDPATGQIIPASYRIDNNETTVPLRLDPRGSVFVVFRKPATTQSRTIIEKQEALLETLHGPWSLQFPGNWGAPPKATLEELISWPESKDSGIKYFSGTAVYNRNISISPDWLKRNARIILDLGRVREIAEVSVNGKPLGICWKPPFRVDITDVLKPGPNQLEIRITNLWPNRLIGDEKPGATHYTFSLIRPFTKDSPLLPSGLLGPVRIYSEKIIISP